MLLDWLTNDGRLIIAARIVRAFAYGFLSIVLAIYLKLIGLNDLVIGLILTATLINSVLFTLLASFYADRIGRRKMLMMYAALMSVYLWRNFCSYRQLCSFDYSCSYRHD